MHELQSISNYWAIKPDALAGMSEMLKSPIAGLSSIDGDGPPPITCVNNGIATIQIQGVITPRMDLMTMLFGGTALDTLMMELHRAAHNPDVQAILLDIDSPGGVAIGPSEVAEIISAINTIKPVWAYVGRNCCSAAYWIASACGKILAQKSALLGSIGVVATTSVQEHPDKDGFKHIEIVSSNAKNKRPDPRTADGLDVIRAELDALEDEFIDAISTYRNIPQDVIKSDFGMGGVMKGAKAVAVAMADGLANYESAIFELSKTINQQNKKGVSPMDKKNETLAITPEQIAAYRAEGAAAERARLLALDDIALDGHADLLNAAKADPEMTAEKLALQIVRAEKATAKNHIAALKAADAALPEIVPSASITAAPVGATPAERALHEWNTKADIRAEFGGDKDAFIAYHIANENGQIKIHKKGE